MLLNSFIKKGTEAGTDESRRGCLAGPVTAAAVILPKRFKNVLLNDSKMVSNLNRKILKKIIEKEALGYSVRFIDNVQIDEINILDH
jgi:ribonuclease HII